MTKSWPLLALAALGAIGAVFSIAAFDWAAWACQVPSSEEGRVLTRGVGACVEFWFNRYQTFFGAIVALGAATIAVIPARGQLKEMYRQSSVSARQPMVDLAKDLENEISFLDDFGKDAQRLRQLLEFYDERDLPEIYQMFGDKMQEARVSVDRKVQSFRSIKARHPVGSAAFDARTNFLDAVVELEEALQDFDMAFRTDIGAVDVEDGEVELTPQEVRAARLRIGKARILWATSLEELRRQLISEVELAWGQIRTLEAQALKR